MSPRCVQAACPRRIESGESARSPSAASSAASGPQPPRCDQRPNCGWSCVGGPFTVESPLAYISCIMRSSAASQVTRKRIAQRVAEQRQAVLEVAVEQIALRGYESVRFADIATAAGVSIGLLQHYFETRDALLNEAFEQHCARMIERLDELFVTETDPWDRIVRMVDELALDPDFGRRAVIWTDMCANSSRRVEVRESLWQAEAGWRRVLHAAIEQGVAQGSFELVLPLEDVVDIVVTLLDGATLTVAGRFPLTSGQRMHETVVRTAATLLGVPDLETVRAAVATDSASTGH